MSNRNNVIRCNPLYAKRRIDAEFATQPSDSDAVTPIEIMVLYCVSPISERGNEAVLRHEPSKNPDVRRLQLPNGIVLSADGTELPCKDELRAAQERIEEVVDLFGRGHVPDAVRRLGAVKHVPEPLDELWRRVQQTKRLIAWRKIELDPYDRPAVHEI